MNKTTFRKFPHMGILPQIDKNPHAELGRIKIDGMLMKCPCGSRVFYGRGINSDACIEVQCYNCLEEASFGQSTLVKA